MFGVVASKWLTAKDLPKSVADSLMLAGTSEYVISIYVLGIFVFVFV